MSERTEISPREVRDLAAEGHIEPEMAHKMFELIRTPNPVEGDVHLEKTTFRHKQVAPEGYYHDKRKELGRKARHVVGSTIYVAAGIADGITDGIVYAATEIVEDIAFGISRTNEKIKDGWQRGKRR